MKLGPRNDQEPPEYPLLPEEVYLAKFAEYGEKKQSNYLNKRTGDYPWQIRLVFEVADPEADDQWQGEKAGAWFDLEMNALLDKSIYHPLYALDPANEPEGGEDLDDYLGKRCRIQVAHTKKGDKTYANVIKVLPLKKGKKASNGHDEAEQKELVGAGAGKKRSAFDVDEE